MPESKTPAPAHLIDPRVESLPPPPPPEKDFSDRLDGVIILVSAEHVYLAKACCASIRQSMGDIPITLLADGPEVDTRELQKLPNVNCIVAQDAMSGEEARLCTGFWVKLLVFWISPYERFLYTDADTLIWGDVRMYAEFDKYDFIAVNRFKTPVIFDTPQAVQENVFDIDVVMKLYPAMDWRGQEAAYAGAFFARRGVFSRDELLKLRQLDCWRCYDMGLFRCLLWRAVCEGKPRIGGHRFHLFPAEQKYTPEDRFLPRDGQRAAIIHWITKKPKLGRPYLADQDYRKLFLKMTGRTKCLGARLFFEDLAVWLGRHKRSWLGQRRHSELSNQS
jgi:hypothetical protein